MLKFKSLLNIREKTSSVDKKRRDCSQASFNAASVGCGGEYIVITNFSEHELSDAARDRLGNMI